MTKKVASKKDKALDDIYREYRKGVAETFAATGRIDLDTLAIVDSKNKGDTPFVVIPLHNIFSNDKKGKIVVDENQIHACLALTKDLGEVEMFMTAASGYAKTSKGEGVSLLTAAKQSNGQFIANLWVEGLEGGDGTLTETVSGTRRSWSTKHSLKSPEMQVGSQLLNSLWKELIITKKVDALFNGEKTTH